MASKPLTYDELEAIEKSFVGHSVQPVITRLANEVRRLNDRLDTSTTELYEAQQG